MNMHRCILFEVEDRSLTRNALRGHNGGTEHEDNQHLHEVHVHDVARGVQGHRPRPVKDSGNQGHDQAVLPEQRQRQEGSDGLHHIPAITTRSKPEAGRQLHGHGLRHQPGREASEVTSRVLQGTNSTTDK